MIATATQSFCTHVGIYYKGKVVEANFNEKRAYGLLGLDDGWVRDRELYDDKDDLILVMRPKFTFDTKAFENLVLNHIQQHDGKYPYHYDLKELLNYALSEKLGLHFSFLENKNAYFCSEYVNDVFVKLGYPLTPYGIYSQLVSPKNILESPYLEFVCLVDGLNQKDPSKEINEPTKDTDLASLNTIFHGMLNGELGIYV